LKIIHALISFSFGYKESRGLAFFLRERIATQHLEIADLTPYYILNEGKKYYIQYMTLK
jgi:hypothetical protein